MKMTSRQTAGISLIVLGFLLFGCGIYLALTPRIYQATARIKVEKEPLSLDEYYSFDPYWVITEFEKIQSKLILYPVISNLQLQVKWTDQSKAQPPLSFERTYELIKSKVDVRQNRSALIEISVRSEDRVEAAAIANAITQEYRHNRIALQEERWSKVPSYSNELQNLEQKIKGLELELINAIQDSADTNKIKSALKDSKHRTEWIKCEMRQASDPNNVKTFVEIVDPAVPALRPVYPNPFLMWGALLSGCALILSGVRISLAKPARPLS